MEYVEPMRWSCNHNVHHWRRFTISAEHDGLWKVNLLRQQHLLVSANPQHSRRQ
jgi:hypothetical protein